MGRTIQYKPNPIFQPIVKHIEETDDGMLHLFTSPGLGDILWILNKVYDNTDKDIHIHSFSRHVYSAHLLENLPKVKKVTQWSGIKAYKEFMKKCQEEYPKYNQLSDLNNIDKMYLEMNTHVDNGNRIETFLPNLKTTFELPYQDNQLERVKSLYKDKEYILIYTSALKNNRLDRHHTGSWNFRNWISIIKSLRSKYKVVWIGSSFDQDALNEVINHTGIDYHLNEPLEFLIPLFRNCKAFLGYQSGLNCITIQEQVPTYMLYFNKLTKLPNAICHPNFINNPKYYYEYFDNYNVEKLHRWIEEL